MSEPRLLALVCNWAYYTPSERQDVERTMAACGGKLVRVPCSGRVSPFLLLNAVQEGYDAVLLVGCAPDACHYREGSRLAHRRLETLREFLVYLGLEPERLQLFWRPAVPKRPFGAVVAEVRDSLAALGPAERLVRSREL